MKRRMKIGCSIAGLVFASFAFSSVAGAQNNAAGAVATPRMPDGKPDFSGFYNSAHFVGDAVEEKPGEHVVVRSQGGSAFFSYGGANEPQYEAPVEANQPSYKPEYMTKVKQIADNAYGRTTALDPQMDCKPLGVPRAGLSIMHIVQTKDVVAIMYEARPGPVFRLIYLDGRKHPENLDTSYMGHSVGRWEGDTLVVDTVGLNDETWLAGGFDAPKYALFHSDQLHVVERFTRNGNQITYNATVEDPVMLTKPWVMNQKTASIAPAGDYIQPQMCQVADVAGKNRKEHLVTPSEKDQFKCGWCNPENIYGLESDKITSNPNIAK